MFDFQDKQNVGGVNDSRTPTTAGAREQNSRNQELKNAVESTGQTLTPISTQIDANTEQLAKAMFVYGCGSRRMQDNGTVNAIQLTPFTGSNGLRVPKASDGGYNILNGASVSFVPANENTGNVTINIGQTTSDLIGPKKLLTESGSEISAGTIQSDGTYEAYYNSSADGGNGAWTLSSQPQSLGPSGVPVGTLLYSTTSNALPGTVAVNVKQKFLLGTYPQLESFVQASGNFLTDEAAWDAEAAAQDGSCGRYCVTDTHIILPCVRHYIGAARPGEVGKDVGDWAGDAFGSHQHTIPWGVSPDTLTGWAPWGFNTDYQDRRGSSGSDDDNTWVKSEPVGGEETRPKTIYHLPCIKVADVAVNAAQVDMIAIADQVAEINGSKVDRSEWKTLVPQTAWENPLGIKWQVGTAGGAGSVTFPVAFSTYQIVIMDGASGETNTGFTASKAGNWIAIGE